MAGRACAGERLRTFENVHVLIQDSGGVIEHSLWSEALSTGDVEGQMIAKHPSPVPV